MSRVFVVIPAYNEAKALGQVVRGILALYPDYQVVVVDDGSADETGRLSGQAGAMVLRHAINRGQGAALATGTTHALAQGADIIVHFDADGQFESAEIARLVAPVERGECEVVLGSRFLEAPVLKTSPQPPPYQEGENKHFLPLTSGRLGGGLPLTKKYLILPLARLVNWLFTGLWLSDAHNGWRVLSRRAAELIQITQDRMAHNSEIVLEIKKHGLKYQELPVTVHYHRYGQGLGGGVRIVKDLLLQKFF